MDSSEKINNKRVKLEKFYPLILLLGCLLFIFANIGLYPLIDIDETRYVNMSKFMYHANEYVTPILNFEPFLEKPPLYFWLNIIVFKIFNTQNLFLDRFATGLISTFGIFFTYFFTCKATKNKLLALLSSYALLSSTWFLIFSHIAILDLDFMVFSMCAIYCACLPLFIENRKHDKFYWFFGWFFMGLSILAKGFIGLAIPCVVVFFAYLFFKRIKDLFKPLNLLPGLVIFLIVTLPWHIAIYEKYGQEWVNMYILKHHFARLLNSQGLGRKQPFLFYVPVLLLGLIPWTFNFVLMLIKDIKNFITKIKSTKSFKQFFEFSTQKEKFIAFSYIYAICVFLFFSSASTKLPSYILTMFPPLALLIGTFWRDHEENKKELRTSNYINSIFFLIISILGLIFAVIYPILLPDNIEPYIKNALPFSIPTLIVVFILSLLIVIETKKKNYVKNFILHIIFMLTAAFCAFGFGLSYYTSFAQDELEEFADYIYEQPESKIVTYDFSTKYSILNPEKKVEYIPGKNKDNYKKLNIYLRKNKGSNIYIISKNSNKTLARKKGFKKIKTGKVYAIYKYR